jgi:hypothetical protein
MRIQINDWLLLQIFRLSHDEGVLAEDNKRGTETGAAVAAPPLQVLQSLAGSIALS